MSILITNKNTPYWLATADIFVGDMSDLTYEALILGIPILQYENTWINENFPVVGDRFKTGPELYKKLSKMIQTGLPQETSMKYSNIIESVIRNSSSNNNNILMELSTIFDLPNVNFEFHHQNNQVYKEILLPIVDQISCMFPDYKVCNTNRSIQLTYKTGVKNISLICHVETSATLPAEDYVIHIGHGLKGDGTALLEKSIETYRSNNYFPSINKFFVAGKMAENRLTRILGISSERISIVGYAKIYKLIEERMRIRKDLLRNDKLIILYGPAGIKESEKPGGSMSVSLLYNLFKISLNSNVKVVIKIKSYRHFLGQIINLIRRG